jgi:pyrimidine-nucleoside phosphorylase
VTLRLREKVLPQIFLEGDNSGMNILDLIIKKRDGQSLSPEEINFLVQEYNNGFIPDYQMAAMLMSIYFQGLNNKETNALTAALAASGETLDFSSL